MLLHDLRLALRHLWRRKLYTAIILLSLTIGFACTSLLVAFLVAETKTDSFHINGHRSFQVLTNDPFGKGNTAYAGKYLPDYLKGNFPEVEEVVQVGTLGPSWLATDKEEFHDVQILSADDSFFSIFSFPIISGSVKNNLRSDHIILSEDKARVLFGTSDAAGKIVTVKWPDTLRTLQVAAVLGKATENSHLVFDALVAN